MGRGLSSGLRCVDLNLGESGLLDAAGLDCEFGVAGDVQRGSPRLRFRAHAEHDSGVGREVFGFRPESLFGLLGEVLPGLGDRKASAPADNDNRFAKTLLTSSELENPLHGNSSLMSPFSLHTLLSLRLIGERLGLWAKKSLKDRHGKSNILIEPFNYHAIR